MKTNSSNSAFFNMRALIGFLSVAFVFVALFSFGVFSNALAQVRTKNEKISGPAVRSTTGSLFDAHSVVAALPASKHRSNGAPSVEPDRPSPEPPLNCAWVAGPNLPTNILDNAVASLGSNLYSFTGVGNGALVTNSYKFDGTTWTAIAAFPVATEYPSAVSDGSSFLYIMNGVTSVGNQTTLRRYDPVANTYTSLAPNTVATWNQAAVYSAGKIYKMGGFDSTTPTPAARTELEIYNVATNTWSMGAPMPTARAFPSAWVQGNFIYVAGGIDATGAATNTAHRYDIMANTWSAIANMATTRFGAATSFYGDSGVIAGGYSGTGTSTIYYSNTCDSWVDTTDMPIGRARMGGAVRGTTFCVVGGRALTDTTFTGSNNLQVLTCSFGPTTTLNNGGATIQSESCTPANGAPDPGELITISFCVKNIGTQATSNLMGTLQATGGVTNPSGPQNYGAVAACSAASVCRNFTFTAGGLCGGTVTATIHFQDGATDLGNQVYTFTLGSATSLLSEAFNDITTLPGAGWFQKNNSSPLGTTNWFQGDDTIFPSQAGAPNAYIAANFQNTTDLGTISDWLLTPPVTLQNGRRLVFWTRTVTGPQFPDRLQVRMSTNGSSTNVGTLATDVGDFTTLLLDINPTYTTTAYPAVWTQFVVTVTGVASPTMGRLAFRYFVENAGSNAPNSDYIGIDTVSYQTAITCSSCSATSVSSAVSRRTHGGAGNMDINLPLTGTTGVEDRSGGATNDFTMVVTFGGNVTVSGSPQAQVTSGTATIGSGGVSNGGAVTVAGNVVTIPLTNVADQQTINVTLNGVNAAFDSPSVPAVNVVIPMSRLLGDSNGNRAVNASDVTQTKGRIAQPVTSVNFRSDINANGAINAGDVSLAKANTGHAVP